MAGTVREIGESCLPFADNLREISRQYHPFAHSFRKFSSRALRVAGRLCEISGRLLQLASRFRWFCESGTTLFFIKYQINGTNLTFFLFGKWFIFSAVGLRLFLAGIRQITKPVFTAKEIFHIDNPDCLPIVRELGFANLCFGLVGIISIVKPEWRMVSAFASGLYYGLAGLLHIIKKPVNTNEKIALWTDVIIFLLLLIYFMKTI